MFIDWNFGCFNIVHWFIDDTWGHNSAHPDLETDGMQDSQLNNT